VVRGVRGGGEEGGGGGWHTRSVAKKRGGREGERIEAFERESDSVREIKRELRVRDLPPRRSSRSLTLPHSQSKSHAPIGHPLAPATLTSTLPTLTLSETLSST
jgi:hypothetical protein